MEGRKLVLRPAQLEDAPAIARVRILTWQDAYKTIVDPEFLATLDLEKAVASLTERMRQEALEGVGTHRTVVELKGEVVAFCVCGIKPDEPFIGDWFMYALYVLPTVQGMGVGKSLVREAQDEGRRRGATRMVFGVFADNEKSKCFYFGTGATYLETGQYELGGRSYPTDYCQYPL